MAIACDPEATFDVVLDCDKGKKNPPTLIYHYLSTREWMHVASVNDRLKSESGIDDAKMVVETAKTALVGWRDFTDRAGTIVMFDPDELDAILSLPEIYEIVATVALEGMTPDEVKKSDVQSQPNTTSSAAVALEKEEVPNA